MNIEYIAIDWDKIEETSYIREIDALRGVRRLDFTSRVTFFTGENGSGKSTLLEAIAIAYGFNPEGGTRNYRFTTYDDHSPLYKAITLGRGLHGGQSGFFLRSESFFNLSSKTREYEQEDGRIMFGDRTLHEQSHGESFLSFISSFRKEGLYLMDEPEAAISAANQMTLLANISRMSEKGAQYIIVTHSPILLALPEAQIRSFDGEGLQPISYEDTPSYRITEMFINNRDTALHHLLK